MKQLLYQFQTINTQRIFSLNPEGVDVPTEARATPRIVDPESAAAAVAAHGADLTAAVGHLPGSGEARAIASDIEHRIDTGAAFDNLTATLEAFSQTDFNNPDNPNLFSMFMGLLDHFGIDLESPDSNSSTGSSSSSSRSPSRGPDGSGPTAPPRNVDIPELDEAVSPEDMAFLQERARDADVDNLTTPAKNIAIATLRAYPNLTITSGYRGPERNARAGGAVGSDHLTGNAMDIGTTDPAVQRWVQSHFPGQVWTDIHGSGGSGPANHLHVSYRPGGTRVA